MERNGQVKSIVETSVFITIVFIGVYLIKIPAPGGYVHIGDSMIFLAVLFLGTKRGALAGGIGAALSDVLGGYGVWILPTFFLKGIMALIMGTLISKKLLGLKGRSLWIISATIAGIAQIAGYAVVTGILYGKAMGIASIPGLILQVAVGLVIAIVLSEALSKTSLKNKYAYEIF